MVLRGATWCCDRYVRSIERKNTCTWLPNGGRGTPKIRSGNNILAYDIMEPEQVDPEVQVDEQQNEPLEKPRKEKKPRKPPTPNQLAALAKGRELRATKFKVVPKEEPKPVEPEATKPVSKPRVRKERIVYYDADSDSEGEMHAPPAPKHAPALKRVQKHAQLPSLSQLHFV